MGLNRRKSIKLDNGVKLNFGKKGFTSYSVKSGNTTFNSKGKTTVNLGNGFSYSFGGKKKKRKKTTTKTTTRSKKNIRNKNQESVNLLPFIVLCLSFASIAFSIGFIWVVIILSIFNFIRSCLKKRSLKKIDKDIEKNLLEVENLRLERLSLAKENRNWEKKFSENKEKISSILKSVAFQRVAHDINVELKSKERNNGR